MKVSGFSFIRDGVKLGYPFEQSIRSILPLVDEYVIAVGDCSDDTRKVIESIGSDKIKIIDTVWNPNMRKSGFVYAQQKMIAWYHCTGDWAFYLEGDEVLHEQDIPKIKAQLEEHLHNPEVECFAFNYQHFYASSKHVSDTARWYRQEARIIRNSLRGFSTDGLFFVVATGTKRGRYPNGINLGASIYHYGNVKTQEQQREKHLVMNHFWNSTGSTKYKQTYAQVDPQSVVEFKGTHPEIMQTWLEDKPTTVEFDPSYQLTKREKKHRLTAKIEKWFDVDLSKKHWKPIKLNKTK